MKHKNITIRLFKEQNKQVSSILAIHYNIKTENVQFLHKLYYLNNTFCLTKSKNKELKCINKHTIKQYEKHRKRDAQRQKNEYKKVYTKKMDIKNGYKKQHYNGKKKCLGATKICKNLRSDTYVDYYIDTNYVSIITNIMYKSRYIKIGRMK